LHLNDFIISLILYTIIIMHIKLVIMHINGIN
jgi:hypothetical protein